MNSDIKIAVCIPCYNEVLSIGKVVQDFKRALPAANICVFDNNSTDGSARIAKDAGAIIYNVPSQGKGNVVRSMFREIQADFYVMVDGDDTYPADVVQRLMEPVMSSAADMVVGDRLSNLTYSKSNTRRFHQFGNELVKNLINTLFRSNLNDVMSGYRVLNKLFVKTMPVMSKGFEIETEMTIHAVDKNFKVKEIPIHYRDRGAGSESKLRTFKDGFNILKTIIWVFKHYKPMIFFSCLAALLFCLSGLTSILPLMEYFTQQYVYRVPMFILSVGLAISALLMFVCGLILDTVVRYNKERYEVYLNHYIHKYFKEDKIGPGLSAFESDS